MPRPTTRARVASTRAATTNTDNDRVTGPKPTTEQTESVADNSESEEHRKGKSRQTRGAAAAHSSALARSASNSSLRALKNARPRRDSALNSLANTTSATHDGLDESSVELGRRGDSTPLHARLPEYSGLDLDDDAFDDLDTTFDIAGPASAVRSHDTSTLSTSHFKRRRAGSFLSREDGPLRPSSRAGPNTPGISSAFNIGVFKRRAREPSILGTAQKPKAQRPAEPESDDDLGAGEEDDFAPEAESTPFKNTKRRSEAGATVEKEATSASSRKRKSTDAHEGRETQSSQSGGSPGVMQSVELADTSAAPSSPTLQTHRQNPSRPVTPDMDPSIMAPPMSSGSEDEQEIWPPIKALAKGRAKRPADGLRRTPVHDDNPSDMSSPPSLTHSPNYPEPSPPPARQGGKRKTAAGKKASAKITTAHLTGLLPRRRRQKARAEDVSDADDDEVDISGRVGDDDDELFLDVRGRRRRPAAGKNAASAGNRGKPSTRTSRRAAAAAAAAAAADASEETSAATATNKNKRLSRTYGRNSDKENEDDDDEHSNDEAAAAEESSSSLTPVPDDLSENDETMMSRPPNKANELRDAVRKFAEVDKWELEYEERMESSSPSGAR